MNLINLLDVDYCESLGPVISLAKNVVNLLKWGIPIVLIVFGMIDLGKAVIASKEDEMKKAQGTLIKRFIYAIVVFFVVTLVTFAIDLVGGSAKDVDTNSWLQCWNQTK